MVPASKGSKSSQVAQPSIRRLRVSGHNVDAQGRIQQVMTVSGNVLPECNASPWPIGARFAERIARGAGAEHVAGHHCRPRPYRDGWTAKHGSATELTAGREEVSMSDGKTGLQLRSLLKKSGELELSLVERPDAGAGRRRSRGPGRGHADQPVRPRASDRPGRHVDRQGFRHQGRSRGHREDAGSGHADDGGAARSVDAGRQ